MKRNGLKLSLIIISLLVASLAVVIKSGYPMYFSFLFTFSCALLVMRLKKACFRGLIGEILDGQKTILPVVIVLASIGMMIAAWMYSGSLAAYLYLGLTILPHFNIVLAAFLLTAAFSMLLGTAVGTIGSIGILLMILAKSFAIPSPLVAGAIVSGSYFGDRTSPFSSSANLTARLSGIDIHRHIRALSKTSLLPFLLTLWLYYVLGSQYKVTTAIRAAISQSQTLLNTTFSIHAYHFIPIVVLIAAMTLFKVTTSRAVLASLLSAWLLTLYQQLSQIDFLRAIIAGYYPQNSAIKGLYSGSGLISMTSIFLVLSSAALLNAAINHFKLLDPLFAIVDRKLNSAAKLIVGSGLSATVVMLLTGNQSLPAIVAADHYAKYYDHYAVNRQWLSIIISDFMIIIVAIPPWNINAILVDAIIDVASYQYTPYAFLPLIMPLTTLLTVLIINRRTGSFK